ncbi:hypothetical protein QFC22_000499 [Naganishia vaughanmartiniae]|uniref:Uncharacterized protein n=1 Tax=Naganishia vaughanmartiniae TaxID=1424756 RepID=A0ACC2XPK6_9TREE|nr:hypothetical protein QFC22_000499 [Naganishia vaughanmartiniae]
MSSPSATFLDLPDDVILEIAELCGSGYAGGGLAADIPTFSHIHRRSEGLIGDDFWKKWCRKKGYAIPRLVDELSVQLACEINPWARWDDDVQEKRCSPQNFDKLLTPDAVISSGASLSWLVSDDVLKNTLKELYDKLQPLRTTFIANAKEQNERLVFSVIETMETRLRGMPWLHADGQTLALQSSSLLTSPPVTGIVLGVETYGEQLNL